ncbi:MAG TPA: GAF domain-containing protein [Methylomirabilota bacterium]|nr:GAF domain-containing protein [Methylomirabilota bacterium]
MTELVRPRGRLVRKYAILCAGLVSGALAVSGLVELSFSYRESLAALVALQREKAAAAATRIEAFVREIERQIGWASQSQLRLRPTPEQRRLEYLRLLHQAPAITEVALLDRTGREQLRVSRLAMDVTGSQADFSRDPRFLEPRPGTPYFGPVYFRKESEPYLSLAVAAPGDAEVTVAEVNLKFIWDVVSRIRVGRTGLAYVVDGRGQLVAHPDISLVLQKTDLSRLDQVRAVLGRAADHAGEVTIATGPAGGRVLTASAEVAPLGWWVFVEQPLGEALAPLYGSAYRTVGLLLAGIALSVVASFVLARRMVTPIQALEAGAARIGAGALEHRIDVRTGDELEGLAQQFNDMAARLHESYATLEHKVEDRTRELSEALAQQTATAEILRVISSSPTDIRPVLDIVAEKAARLCDASDAVVFRLDGDVLRVVAKRGPIPSIPVGGEEGVPVDRGSVTGRAVLDRCTVQVADLASVPEAEYPRGRLYAGRYGHRTTLSTPLLREGLPLGAIMIRRTEVRPFTEEQVRLLETFAAQAAIAIENVRLFQELERRNRDLSEALEQQTATAEILGVISSSPTDLEPVFATILAKACQLCDAELGAVFRVSGELFEVAATHGARREFVDYLRRGPIRVGRPMYRPEGPWRPIHVPDVQTTAAMDDPVWVDVVRIEGIRTLLGVPLVRDGQMAGSIMIYRREVRPFSTKQVQLVTTFATQAVIAIQNVRLFQELQARTRELARSVEQLQALGAVGQAVSSTLDLETVLATIVSRADLLAGADGGTIYEYDEARRVFHLRATQRLDPELVAVARAVPIPLGEGAIGRAALARQPVEIPDTHDAGAYEGPLRDAMLRAGFRAILAVPLLREGRILGGLGVVRRSPGHFAPEVIDLVKTLGAQSAIAIQNARLFRELAEKTQELEAASRHKSEFLANMSHELRTPLNAIIGFSEVLGERMFGELNDKQAEYVQDILSSGRHLLALINDILDLSKVEAGRMELELSRFDLPAAIGSAVILVRERATRHGLTLEVSVDDRLGSFVGDERKIRQVLLNLLSNAVKFTPEGGRVVVRAAPADGAVEVSVADTGIGIAPQDQEAIFEEFRQVGTDYARKREGTGLGLALAKRFVELHGGRISVASRPGEGATFTVALPVRPWPTS